MVRSFQHTNIFKINISESIRTAHKTSWTSLLNVFFKYFFKLIFTYAMFKFSQLIFLSIFWTFFKKGFHDKLDVNLSILHSCRSYCSTKIVIFLYFSGATLNFWLFFVPILTFIISFMVRHEVLHRSFTIITWNYFSCDNKITLEYFVRNNFTWFLSLL